MPFIRERKFTIHFQTKKFTEEKFKLHIKYYNTLSIFLYPTKNT